MKKAQVGQFMWVIGVVILVVAFVIVLWLMSKGWLSKGGTSLSNFLDITSNLTSTLIA